MNKKREEDNFDKIIREKLWEDASPALEQSFKAELDRRFGKEKKPLFDLGGLRPAIALCSFVLVIVVVTYQFQFEKNNNVRLSQANYIKNIVEMEVALETMDEMAQIDDISMSDEEWEILLGEET